MSERNETDTIDEIVSQVKTEIEKLCQENIVGTMSDEQLLDKSVSYMERMMNASLPRGYKARLLSPRLEGTVIKADGWLIEHG